MSAKVAAVVGAGAAGLAAALELRERGVEPVVLEADAHAGGKLSSLREGGYLIERAAHGLLDREGTLAPLAKKLGVEAVAASAAAKKRWVVRDGVMHALPSGPFSFIGSGLLSFREKMRLLKEPWVRRGDPDGESVEQFFSRRLGAGGAFLADALQTGIYASSPDALEMAACFPALADAEKRAGSVVRGLMKARKRAPGEPRPSLRLQSFREGLGELVGAMARALGPALRLDVRVRGLARDGARLRLSLLDREGMSELAVDQLIVAAPASEAAPLLESIEPALADALRALRAAPITGVHLGVRREDVEGDVSGFGLLAPGRPVMGTLTPGSLWAGRAPEGRVLISALVGGARNRAAASLPDGELLDLVRDELAKTIRLKRDAEPELVRIVRWAEAIPQYELGHRARIEAIETLTARVPGLKLTGAWYRGVSVLDCIRDGRRQAAALFT